MKKLLLLLIALIFLAVSCSSSKKAENDADILPDEDMISDDTQENPCKNIENSTGSIVEPIYTGQVGIECGCIENYFWDGEKCTSPCDPDPCAGMKNSTEKCTPKNIDEYSCGCIENYLWNGEICTTTNPCYPNPCEEDKNSTGKCTRLDLLNYYSCECIENYFWYGKKCVNPCDGFDCTRFAYTTGICKPKNASEFSCECDENHYWLGKEQGCGRSHPLNICTGQTKCYDNEKEIACPAEGEDFFGQDAQYARLGYCVQQSFSINYSVEDEPVVIDNNLGLMWQRNIPPVEELYVEDVLQYCEDLVYGGYDDWRLPTIEDILSIADYGKHPALDTEYFPDSGKFWTSTIENDYFIWGLAYDSYQRHDIIFDFDEPTISDVITYEVGDSYSSHTAHSYSFKTRCVRGNYIITWENPYDLIFTKIKTAKTWQEALQHCSELNYAGISDWRVPNVKELLMNSLDGFHSSTTKISDPAFDHKYEKNKILENILCVANDPCGKGKFWNGEKCLKNPCDPNPCESKDALNKTCKPIDEKKYSCGCSKCMYVEHSNGKCFEDILEGVDCHCDEGYIWIYAEKKCISVIR